MDSAPARNRPEKKTAGDPNSGCFFCRYYLHIVI